MICPKCQDGAIRFHAFLDRDGDGIYTSSFWTFDDYEQECDCELTEEEIEELWRRWSPEE